MQQTPKGSQLHIGLFGKRNAGKSTLMNVLLDQELSIVSPVAGTTTDIVHKSKEWHPLGPVVLVDTPGLDDEGELGALRVQKAMEILRQVDLVLWVSKSERLEPEEIELLHQLREKKVPYLFVYNRFHEDESSKESSKESNRESNKESSKERSKSNSVEVEKIVKMEEPSLEVNAKTKGGIGKLKEAITKCLMGAEEKKCIGDKVGIGQIVLLVMPQDLQAPKGRLILPQVQILRELLDAKAIPIMTTRETLKETLLALQSPPSLVITDSQIFKEVYDICPKNVPLTSFSILMGRQKGDLKQYVEGAYKIGGLQREDKVLIAESCTHNPLHGDIARNKIPTAITKKVGEGIIFEHVCGNSFPQDLSSYAIIIQCGGCMHTPKQIQERLSQAKLQNIPITNFGIALAYLMGILENVWLPE